MQYKIYSFLFFIFFLLQRNFSYIFLFYFFDTYNNILVNICVYTVYKKYKNKTGKHAQLVVLK